MRALAAIALLAVLTCTDMTTTTPEKGVIGVAEADGETMHANLGAPTNIHYVGFNNGEHEIWWNKPTGPGRDEQVKYIIEIWSLVDWSVTFKGERTGNVSLFFLFIDDLPVGPYLIYVEAEWNGQTSLGIAEFTVTEGPTPPTPTKPEPPAFSLSPSSGAWSANGTRDNLCGQLHTISLTLRDLDGHKWKMRHRELRYGSSWEETSGNERTGLVRLVPGEHRFQARQADKVDEIWSDWSVDKFITVRPDAEAFADCGTPPDTVRNYRISGGTTRWTNYKWDEPVSHGGWEITHYVFGEVEWPSNLPRESSANEKNGRIEPCRKSDYSEGSSVIQRGWNWWEMQIPARVVIDDDGKREYSYQWTDNNSDTRTILVKAVWPTRAKKLVPQWAGTRAGMWVRNTGNRQVIAAVNAEGTGDCSIVF